MAIIVDAVSAPVTVGTGQLGYSVIYGFAHFSGSDASGTMDCPFAQILDVRATPLGAGTGSGTVLYEIDINTSKSLTVTTTTLGISHQLGSVSATAASNLIAPVSGTITAVSLVTTTAVTADNTNYWTFGLVNKTHAGTVVDATAAANSTKATGGASTVAYTVFPLTLAAGIALTAGDVLEFTVTKAASATTMAEFTLLVTYTVPTTEGGVWTVIVPVAGNITRARFANKNAVAKNDTNYYTFGVVNKTQTLTPVDSTNALNTTKNTGGQSVVAYTSLGLTLGNSAAVACSKNDVLEVTIGSGGAPAALAEGRLQIEVTASSAYAETVFVDDAVVDGVIPRESGGTITFARGGTGLTSGLAFAFEIKGY